jgi:hypothetical protein
VEFLKQNFIPVVQWEPAGQTLTAEFLKRVSKHFANEIAVVTPNAKLLSQNPRAGLAMWRQMPASERRRLEDLGKYDSKANPVPPANGLILNVYSRALKRDVAGRLGYYRGKAFSTLEAGRDHLWLTEKEWQALLPGQRAAGQKYDFPASVLQRLCRRCLISLVSPGGLGRFRRPEEVFAKELKVTVEENSPSRVRLRFDGSCRLASEGPGGGAADAVRGDYYQLRGHMHYDPARKAVTRFDLAAFSETGYYDADTTPPASAPFGVAFALSKGDTDMERFPPTGFSAKEYFSEDAR